MASEHELEERYDDVVGRVDQRSSADLRQMQEQELRLIDRTDLPMVRAKHQQAAARWGEMAAARERVERRVQERAAARSEPDAAS
jgi:hypothetical protein